MATFEQRAAFHSECSAVDFEKFTAERAIEYDPADADYYEDVIEEHADVGIGIGFICLFAFLAMLVWGLILCCVPHHWVEHMNFIGIARSGSYWWQRLLGLMFVLAVVSCTALVSAMSIWGIVRVVSDVQDVVPKAFDFLEDSERQLDSISNNLTAAVRNGNNIIAAVNVAVDEVQTDRVTELLLSSDPEFSQTFDNVIVDLEQSTADAQDALDDVQREINQNLDDLLEGMRDAIGYRDEGEGINDGGRVAVVVAFSFFLFFSIGSTLFSLCGASPRCTLFWASIMWLMLTIAFWLVAFLDVAKVLSKETCLYVDSYAVRELRDVVDDDPDRTEELLWYYFQRADAANKTLTQLEDIWGFPLTQVVDYLDLAESEVFQDGGLAVPYSLTDPTTQEALLNVQLLFPQARADIEYVQDLISGPTFHTLHSDFQDLICCTEYDAVDAVWTAWVVSSAFGLMLTILMTIQGWLSFRFGRSTPRTAFTSGYRTKTQKVSAYMSPPVQETGYRPGEGDMTQRDTSGTPLRSNAPDSNPTVQYPTIKPASEFL